MPANTTPFPADGQSSSRRWGRVRRVGVAEIMAARCECGRPIEPDDLELISERQLRAICAACHRDLFQIDRTRWEERNP
jgi:hypothetical protein